MLLVPEPPISALVATKQRRFLHIVIVPCFIDPIEVLFDCLGSLMTQHEPENLLVVVAFELKTPDLLAKQQAVEAAFGNRFRHFLITIHEIDRQTEIPGGCSNKNYALHQAFYYLRDNHLLQAHSVTVTTCDTDSLFHPSYFKVLQTVYNASNHNLAEAPRMCVWQPPLFYNWDLDKRPFFNRITGLMRSMMMLGGLISFNLNPMSIFSYPLELGLKAGFINPRYGVDDIIAKVRWMCSTDEAVPVLLLPLPCISGPTIGVTLLDEYSEWSRQIRRWIVGSSESFHYFLIHWRGRPLFSGVVWFVAFFSYYAILLCCAGLFGVLAGIPLPWVTYPDVYVGFGVSVSLKYASLAGLVLQYLVFSCAFVIDKMAIKMMTVKEDISVFRNALHLLLAPPTLLVYSFISFKAIVKFVFKGKVMARHDMAGKEGMVASAVVAVESGSSEVEEYDERLSITDSGKARVRSTSVSRERTSMDRTSLDGLSLASSVLRPNDVSHAANKEPHKLLCTLPENFYFGEHAMNVASLPLVARFEGVLRDTKRDFANNA